MLNFKEENKNKYQDLLEDVELYERKIHCMELLEDKLLYKDIFVVTKNEPDNPFEARVDNIYVNEKDELILEVKDDGSNTYEIQWSDLF